MNNPLWPKLRHDWPIGWVLEDLNDRIVGYLNNVPSSYRFRGETLVCANGHGWGVLRDYRGYAPLLMDEYFTRNRADLFISSKVGREATAVWTTYASRVPVGDWEHVAFMVTHYRGFALRALERMGVPLAGVLAPAAAAALLLRNALRAQPVPADASSVEYAEADGFDSRFDAFWQELQRQNPDRLLAARDRKTLCWHFAIPMNARRVWVFTASRNNLLRAYCVLKQHIRPQGMRSMKLVDYQTLDCNEDLLPGLLRVALRRCTAEDGYVLEHHGCGLQKMRAFDELAPYRAKKPAWSFYYRAANSTLRADLESPNVWDPSEFDGDASYK